MRAAWNLRNPWAAAALLLAIGTAVNIGLASLVRSEGNIRITLACSERYAAASFNGRQSLTIEDASPAGPRVGLYAFSPYEGTGERVSFRDLSLRPMPAGSPANERTISLVDSRDAKELDAGGGWTVRPGKGLQFLGAPGRRSAALLRGAAPADFVLDVTLQDASDAGIMFHAADSANGMVLVVRPRYNDAFFFRLTGGEPGPILNLVPLKDLTVAGELLRLSQLVLSLAVRAGWFLAMLWIILALLPGRPIPGSAWMVRLARSPAMPVMLGLLAFSAMAAVARYACDAIPHIEDEKAYFFQARIFAAGHLWAPTPPMPEFFEHWHVIMSEGRWFGKYPPLFPALLALGIKAGAYWLVNPALGAVTAVCIFLLARRVGGPACGVTASLLAIASPFFLIMGGGLMSHMATAAFLSLALVLALRAAEGAGPVHGFAAGVCGGLAMLTRPYTSVLLLSVLALYFARAWLTEPRRRELARALLCFALGFLPLVALGACSNSVYTRGGSASGGLYELYDKSDTLGFGPDRGVGQRITWGSWGHTPAKAIRSGWQYLDNASHYLMGWPGRLSLAFMFVPLVFGRKERMYALFVAGFLVLAVGHGFYWSCEHVGVGPRYWFEALPGILILSAAGIRAIANRGDPPPPADPEGEMRLTWRQGAMALVMAGLVGWSLCGYLPERLENLHRLNGITVDLKREAESRGLSNAVVFVTTEGLYGNDGFYLNDPFLKTGPVFARDLGPKNQDLLRHFPGYAGYTWDKKALRPMHPAESGRPSGDSREGGTP